MFLFVTSFLFRLSDVLTGTFFSTIGEKIEVIVAIKISVKIFCFAAHKIE